MVFHALWRDLDSRLSLGYVTQQCIVPIPHLWVSVTKWAKCFSQTLPTFLPIAWLERQVFQRSQEINRNGCLDKFIQLLNQQLFELPPASQDLVDDPLALAGKYGATVALAGACGCS